MMMGKPTSKIVELSSEPTFASRHHNDPVKTIVRAALAKALHVKNRSISPEALASQLWPFDTDIQLLLRAAAPPRDMTNAAALVGIGQAILPMLAPYSASARLFAAALSVSLGPEGAIMIPGLTSANVSFTRGGGAKPVVQSTSSAVRLDPHKMTGIAVATDELLSSSSAETMIQNMLAESAGPALDLVAFSSAAATPDAPAGLLYGITPLTASVSTDFFDALAADVATVVGAIAPVAGAGNVGFVMHPAQYFSVRLRTFDFMEAGAVILATAALPVGSLVAIALNALVSATSPPQFETGTQTMLSMNDTPTAWPNPPVSSMFQTASTAIKMVNKVSWALRSSQAIAVINGVKW
jgi:hypothetical protein